MLPAFGYARSDRFDTKGDLPRTIPVALIVNTWCFFDISASSFLFAVAFIVAHQSQKASGAKIQAVHALHRIELRQLTMPGRCL
jgi:hypothetical protein